MNLFKIYRQMWLELFSFKKEYDKYNHGIWSKFLFWTCCTWEYVKATYRVLKNCIIVFSYYLLFMLKRFSPWTKAKIYLCWNKYVESEWYRERLVIMGEKYTIQRFIDGDWKFFRDKITRKEKWGILFFPYTYIENNVPWISCDIGDIL